MTRGIAQSQRARAPRSARPRSPCSPDDCHRGDTRKLAAAIRILTLFTAGLAAASCRSEPSRRSTTVEDTRRVTVAESHVDDGFDLPPKTPLLDVPILVDDRCRDCDFQETEERVQTTVPYNHPPLRWRLHRVDIGDPLGAALWKAIKPARLPAAILTADTAKTIDPRDGDLEFARRVGNDFVLSTGDWNPDCVEATDCARSACAREPACRPERPGRLDLFMLPHCYFLKRTLRALADVIANFRANRAPFVAEIHFIGNDVGAGVLTSVYGAMDVAEGCTRVCVRQHHPRGLIDFQNCRASNYVLPWSDCTGRTTGVDTATVADCIADPALGATLLRSDYAESEALRIQWSPTWVVNGKFRYHGVDAETVKEAVCAHNKLPGCDVRLGTKQYRSKGQAR